MQKLLKIIRKIVKPLRIAHLRWMMRDAEYEISHLRALRDYSIAAEHQQLRRQMSLAEQCSRVEAW